MFTTSVIMKAALRLVVAGASLTCCACILIPDCAMAQSPRKMPNVLWIMLDDCRADAIGCYGKPWARTPNMDAIAAAGVRFETAIVQSPVCVPSRHSMKTGLYAHQTGVMAMGKPADQPGEYQQKSLPLAQQTNLLHAWIRQGVPLANMGKADAFAEDFQQMKHFQPLLGHAGQPTELFKPEWESQILSQVHTKTHLWLIGGVVDVPISAYRPTRIGSAAVRTLQCLLADEDPFFLRVSFHAPHVACFVPPSHLIDPCTIDLPLPTAADKAAKPNFEQHNLRVYSSAPDLTHEEIGLARGTYYGIVSLVDDQVGRILRVLKESGRYDDTIVVINADQGFLLGEHGNWKKRDFYDANVCTPLIICAPGHRTSQVVTEPVEMIDFIPTLIDLCGLELPTGIRGRSLVPLISGDLSTARRACFSEHDYSQDVYAELRDGGSRRVMVRTKEWKLVFFMDERARDEDGALYHLTSDAEEQHNLFADSDHQQIVERLTQLARDWDQGLQH